MGPLGPQRDADLIPRGAWRRSHRGAALHGKDVSAQESKELPRQAALVDPLLASTLRGLRGRVSARGERVSAEGSSKSFSLWGERDWEIFGWNARRSGGGGFRLMKEV